MGSLQNDAGMPPKFLHLLLSKPWMNISVLYCLLLTFFLGGFASKIYGEPLNNFWSRMGYLEGVTNFQTNQLLIIVGDIPLYPQFDPSSLLL